MFRKKLFVLFTFFIFTITLVMCKPNIVVFLTDDQDEILGGMTPLSRTQQLIVKRGVTFVNSFTATPVCCPSRATLLTGKYPHNHKAVNNSLSGGCSSTQWQSSMEPNTFAAILHKQGGYETFYAGKYLNQYGHIQAGGPQHVPVGWTTWRGLVGNSVYYNFTLSHDGIPVDYHNGEYLTDVIKDLAMEFIGNVSETNNPFLMVLAPPAPHDPFTPAPRHQGFYKSIKAPRTPNFNIPATEDKHWLMHMFPDPLSDDTIDKLDDLFRSRWETLLAVDEMIEEVTKTLTSLGLDDNTYYIITSDHGFHIGQFAQPLDKRQPYETDIRVPLIVRGPGITPNEMVLDPAINIDLAPTIVKIAGLEPPLDMDGIPLSAITTLGDIHTNEVGDDSYEREMLIEYHGEASIQTDCPFEDDQLYNCFRQYECRCQDSRNNTYSCVRHMHPTIDYVYCLFNDTVGTEESYNIMEDPFQMVNTISYLMPAIKYKYQNNLQHLTACSGINCNDFNH